MKNRRERTCEKNIKRSEVCGARYSTTAFDSMKINARPDIAVSAISDHFEFQLVNSAAIAMIIIPNITTIVGSGTLA